VPGPAALLVADDSRGRGVPSATLVVPARLPVLGVSADVAARARAGDRVTFGVDASVARATTSNVIAERGEGERVVMAGAHLDSVPAGPGINDNASGVAALLAVARAWGARPTGRLRLAFWGAEELGLVGSRHYVRALAPAQRRRIVAYVNLDMVGSPNPLPAVYADADPSLARLLRSSRPGPEEGVSVGSGSDHASFEEAGIPVGGLYTGAAEPARDGRPSDPCYHLPCDTVANVDRATLQGMARATARALRRLAAQG
jgi:Zn-dependent M28 family amino/carboxypeptidase